MSNDVEEAYTGYIIGGVVCRSYGEEKRLVQDRDECRIISNQLKD